MYIIYTICTCIKFYSTTILYYYHYSIRTMMFYTCTYSLLCMCCRLAAALERESRDLISMLSSSIILRGRESLCARRGADVGWSMGGAVWAKSTSVLPAWLLVWSGFLIDPWCPNGRLVLPDPLGGCVSCSTILSSRCSVSPAVSIFSPMVRIFLPMYWMHLKKDQQNSSCRMTGERKM